MGVGKTVGKVGGVVGVASALYAKVAVEGRPLAEPDKPAAIKLLGLTVWRRKADSLEREWLGGLIKRGQSKRTKEALAARGEQ